MSDARPGMGDPPTPTPTPTTAGGMLRQARQAQGVQLAVLAASLKVVPRKLEALEADRYDQLLDATFTRALAQGVCRQLRIDPAPVLSALPPLNGHRLEQVAEGLKTPFHDGPRRMATMDWASIGSPVLWLLALIVAMTVAVYVLPSKWLPFVGTTTSPTLSGDSNASHTNTNTKTDTGTNPTLYRETNRDTPGIASETILPSGTPVATGATTASAAISAPRADASAPVTATDEAATTPVEIAGSVPTAPAAITADTLQIRATAPSWIGVTGAQGQSLLARVVNAGESIEVDGVPPFKLTVGNVRGTEIVFNGRKVDLAGADRGNVARLELK